MLPARRWPESFKNAHHQGGLRNRLPVPFVRRCPVRRHRVRSRRRAGTAALITVARSPDFAPARRGPGCQVPRLTGCSPG
jgi:hypothetical protein